MPIMPFSQPSITSPSPSTNTRGSSPSVVLKTVFLLSSIQPCRDASESILQYGT